MLLTAVELDVQLNVYISVFQFSFALILFI